MPEKRVIIKSDLPEGYHQKLTNTVKKRHVKDFTRSLIVMFLDNKLEIPEPLKKYLK